MKSKHAVTWCPIQLFYWLVDLVHFEIQQGWDLIPFGNWHDTLVSFLNGTYAVLMLTKLWKYAPLLVISDGTLTTFWTLYGLGTFWKQALQSSITVTLFQVHLELPVVKRIGSKTFHGLHRFLHDYIQCVIFHLCTECFLVNNTMVRMDVWEIFVCLQQPNQTSCTSYHRRRTVMYVMLQFSFSMNTNTRVCTALECSVHHKNLLHVL